jgi:hypothetical protein
MQSLLNSATGVAMSQHVHNPLQPQHQEKVPDHAVINLTPATVCPNETCSRVWSVQEIEYQSCEECGFPLHQEHAENSLSNLRNHGAKNLVFDFSTGDYLH